MIEKSGQPCPILEGKRHPLMEVPSQTGWWCAYCWGSWACYSCTFIIYTTYIGNWHRRQFFKDKHPFSLNLSDVQDSKCAPQLVAHRKPVDLFEVSDFLVSKDVVIQQRVQQHPDVTSVQAGTMWFLLDDVFQWCLDCFLCVDIRVKRHNIKRNRDHTFQMIGIGVFEVLHKFNSAVLVGRDVQEWF